jgi:hypothetical protein
MLTQEGDFFVKFELCERVHHLECLSSTVLTSWLKGRDGENVLWIVLLRQKSLLNLELFPPPDSNLTSLLPPQMSDVSLAHSKELKTVHIVFIVRPGSMSDHLEHKCCLLLATPTAATFMYFFLLVVVGIHTACHH